MTVLNELFKAEHHEATFCMCIDISKRLFFIQLERDCDEEPSVYFLFFRILVFVVCEELLIIWHQIKIGGSEL